MALDPEGCLELTIPMTVVGDWQCLCIGQRVELFGTSTEQSKGKGTSTCKTEPESVKVIAERKDTFLCLVMNSSAMGTIFKNKLSNAWQCEIQSTTVHGVADIHKEESPVDDALSSTTFIGIDGAERFQDVPKMMQLDSSQGISGTIQPELKEVKDEDRNEPLEPLECESNIGEKHLREPAAQLCNEDHHNQKGDSLFSERGEQKICASTESRKNVKQENEHPQDPGTEESVEEYSCRICEKNFKKPWTYEKHMYIHRHKKNQRLVSNRWRYISKTDKGEIPIKHVKAKAKSTAREVEHPCSICSQTFKSRSSLSIHRNIHKGEKPFRCSSCDKAYTTHQQLRNHNNTHTGEKPFVCFICGKTLTQNIGLQNHLMRHTGERPYKCPTCDKSFISKTLMKQHQTIHTGVKPYECSVCQKTFRTHQYWKCHMRTHTGERPYPCAVCEKAFPTQSARICHMLVHTGERNYNCSTCGKYFRTKNHRKRHERIHTGEKPYECSVCGQRFIQNECLKRHSKKHDERDTRVLPINIS